ncbi:MAG TPA: C4-type zinc ribbon domain-containing protein [Candidatus Omnitrophota bacterium]|nr:C4-type zinc ribbon domain-containing protein [Candidatus Omnitrophota bacterium]HPN88818.1 C4-type zinc ribbon domain-containing protein [Candidatus Omnitrophota bacterium]
MADTHIKQQMVKLIELQKIDSQIFDFNRHLAEKPKEVEALKIQFESKKTKLNQLEESLKKVQLVRRDLEVDMKSKEEQIAKANTQLSLIKTNKEYTAKISEIESMKADKSIIEEKILLSYDDADKIQADINQEKQIVAQEEKKYLDRKKEVEDYIKDVEHKINQLKTNRQLIVPQVDKEILIRYEKILKHKEGIAVVPMKGAVCGGCFMNLQPQRINEIKAAQSLIECDMCSCILYSEENI